MCTLIVCTRKWKDAQLVVAANRDEKLDRPSLSPRWFTHEGVKIYAPLDERAGGTWLGLNEHRVFAGVTNRFGDPADPRRRSRGLLVLDALVSKTAKESFEKLSRVSAGAHNPFHLLIADETSAFLLIDDGRQLVVRELEPGIHAFTERSLRGEAVPREEHLSELVGTKDFDERLDVETWKKILSHHDEKDPLRSLCVHFEALGYGTRSSTLVELRGKTTRFFHAERAPCTTPYTELDLDSIG